MEFKQLRDTIIELRSELDKYHGHLNPIPKNLKKEPPDSPTCCFRSLQTWQKLKSLDEALETLVKITTSTIGAERGTIFLNDAATGELYSRIAQGNFRREIRIMNTKGVAGWVFSPQRGCNHT